MNQQVERQQLRGELVALSKTPPQEFSKWGAMQTRAWLQEVRRSRRCLKGLPRVKTAKRYISAIRAVSTMSFEATAE